MMPERSTKMTLAGAIAVLGGVLAVIGSFLSWATASAEQINISGTGFDVWEGKATVVGGVLLILCGIAAPFKGSLDQAKRFGLLAGGVLVAGVGVYAAVTAKNQVIDIFASTIAKQFGVSLEQARSVVNQAVDSGVLKIALDIGLFMVIAAGVVGIVAGLLAMFTTTPAPSMPAAAGGVGLTGWAAPQVPETPSSAPSSRDPNAPTSSESPRSPGVTPMPAPESPGAEPENTAGRLWP